MKEYLAKVFKIGLNDKNFDADDKVNQIDALMESVAKSPSSRFSGLT
jgi:thymidylate synthase